MLLTALYQLSMKMPSKGMMYTAKFKLQVVKFAEDTNNCAASQELCVHKKLFRDWRKQIEKLKCMPKNKCSTEGRKTIMKLQTLAIWTRHLSGSTCHWGEQSPHKERKWSQSASLATRSPISQSSFPAWLME